MLGFIDQLFTECFSACDVLSVSFTAVAILSTESTLNYDHRELRRRTSVQTAETLDPVLYLQNLKI
jgi:hypothetical protein